MSSQPSTPPPPNVPSSASSTAAALSSSSAPTRDAAPHISSSSIVSAPDGIKLQVVSLAQVDWPSDLILDVNKSNWIEWSHRLDLLALSFGLESWLSGSFLCPDLSAALDAHYIWNRNDGALRAFIQTHVSTPDANAISRLPSFHLMYSRLWLIHEQQGTFAQVQLFLKALKVDFEYDKPLEETLATIENYAQRILSMGPLSDDHIVCMLILNAMMNNFGPLQHSITSLSGASTLSSLLLGNHIRDEAAFIRCCTEAGLTPNPYSSVPVASPSSAFAAVSSRSRTSRPTCANCKKDMHSTDYCLAPGGKMAGRTIEEARAARLAARKKERLNIRSGSSTHVANTLSSSLNASSAPVPSFSTSSDTVFLNGKLYAPVEPSWAPASIPSSAHITKVVPDGSSPFPYHAFIACSDLAFAASSDSPCSPSGSVLPFILDSGASCHLSPFLSDFKSIRPIKPHPIKGLGGHSISALGVGLIELQTPLGILSLCDALYVPSSGVRLLSIFRLGEAGFTAHFYPRDGHCFVSDSTNTIVARGSALSDRGLFVLSSFKVPIHSHPSFSPSAYFSSRLPDVDSWHKRLGHCGPNAVIDMARSQAVEGMLINQMFILKTTTVAQIIKTLANNKNSPFHQFNLLSHEKS